MVSCKLESIKGKEQVNKHHMHYNMCNLSHFCRKKENNLQDNSDASTRSHILFTRWELTVHITRHLSMCVRVHREVCVYITAFKGLHLIFESACFIHILPPKSFLTSLSCQHKVTLCQYAANGLLNKRLCHKLNNGSGHRIYRFRNDLGYTEQEVKSSLCWLLCIHVGCTVRCEETSASSGNKLA